MGCGKSLPSHIVIEVASEAHSKEEDSISNVITGNLKDVMKVLPEAAPGPPSDHLIETKTIALLVTYLAFAAECLEWYIVLYPNSRFF